VSAIVADASPLINLARADQFDLLPAFFGKIVIAQAVYEEVVEGGWGRDGSREVKDAAWIEIREPKDDLAMRALATELGEGEAASIVLAQELQAALLLMDEIRGRRIAQQLGLNIQGTLGLLARAKREGRIDNLKRHLDLLIERGTWIDAGLYAEVLRLMGE